MYVIWKEHKSFLYHVIIMKCFMLFLFHGVSCILGGNILFILSALLLKCISIYLSWIKHASYVLVSTCNVADRSPHYLNRCKMFRNKFLVEIIIIILLFHVRTINNNVYIMNYLQIKINFIKYVPIYDLAASYLLHSGWHNIQFDIKDTTH